LPYAEHPPAPPPQEQANDLVAFLVAGDFRTPESAARFGHSVVPTTAVPEATVYKHRESGAGEDEVGAARESLMPAPAGDACRTKDGGKPQLGGFVATGPDGGHDLGPFGFCENVGHEKSLTDGAGAVMPVREWRACKGVGNRAQSSQFRNMGICQVPGHARKLRLLWGLLRHDREGPGRAVYNKAGTIVQPETPPAYRG
jgi:hypothetical protein